jgi:hypothetical protein
MTKKQTKEKNPPALTLKDILAAVDLGAKDLWDDLSEEQQECITFYTLGRFISTVSSPKEYWQKGKIPSREEQESFVLKVNEYYNLNWFSLYKHPKLMWLLICSCAYYTKDIYFHEYIKLGRDKNSKTKILEKLYPNIKLSDIEVMSKLHSLKEIIQLAQDHGWDDKTIKEHL